jgi:hypothetical protein
VQQGIRLRIRGEVIGRVHREEEVRRVRGHRQRRIGDPALLIGREDQPTNRERRKEDQRGGGQKPASPTGVELAK